jgi:hypothetical protein
MVPGTASLVSQVAPDVTAIWRVTFTMAGVAGAAGVLQVVPVLRQADSRTSAVMMLALGLPLYVAVALVAAVPGLHRAISDQVTGLQVEAIMFSLLVLLSVQVAWTVAMVPGAPPEDD